MLPETTREGAVSLCDRLLHVVSQDPFVYEEHSYAVTISAGVATTLGENATLPVDLIRQADENLYQAKREGRNKVCG